MIIAVAGGNLQGVEAAYLARKAGWHVIVFDRHPHPPASGICDRFVQVDLEHLNDMKTRKIFIQAVKEADFILPALENDNALNALSKFAREYGIPLAFSAEAYAVSSSKLRSDALFARTGIPAPLTWPACGFPAIGKPDSASGSQGIEIFHTESAWEAYMEKHAAGLAPPVMQQYLEGPSYSMEVMGMPENYIALQTTELFMDEVHDCCRVTAPVALPEKLVKEFEALSLSLAEKVNLKGIMDVEVILNDGRLKVLEIDARLPSQTPSAVFHSTGINMVELLGDIFVKNNPLLWNHAAASYNGVEIDNDDKAEKKKHVTYEHIRVSGSSSSSGTVLFDDISFCGEHIMATGTPLFLINDFFGADEAISDYRPGCSQFAATLIFSGTSPEDVQIKRKSCFKAILSILKQRGSTQ